MMGRPSACFAVLCLAGLVSSCFVSHSPNVVAARHEATASPAPVAAPLAPPPRVVSPMQGAPDAAQLAEARLVVESCEFNERAAREVAQKRIAAMRKAVDEQFAEWRSLPLCGDVPRKHGPPAMASLRLTGVGEGGGGWMAQSYDVGAGAIGSGGGARQYVRQGAGSAPEAHMAKRASGTNNQVDGVDDADLVKNDGRYVYLATNGALRIVEAMHPRLLSVTKLEGRAREMLLEGDRAVVFTSSGGAAWRDCKYGYDCEFGGDGSQTKVVVLNIADRSHPSVIREIALSGSLIASRRIGTAVHVVVADGDSIAPSYATWVDDVPSCHGNEPVVRAKFERLKRDNEKLIRAAPPGFPIVTEGGKPKELCSVLRPTIDDGQAYTSVISFDMNDDKTPVTTSTVQSRPGAVFASQDGLYLAVGHQRSARRTSWYRSYGAQVEVSDVHKFRIGPSPTETHYVGSGLVPGHVLNQFSMDEWYGYLRIATTQGRVPDPFVESSVSILAESDGGNLVRVGAIEHIAPHEDIRAVRFDGDRGYVVTFKKTDPLFVLDLYHPAEPTILGELKIPGFSTYLHRIDPNHLLSIGFDANDHGDFAYFDGIILQLFDVTRPTEPQLLHKETIGTRGSSSEAATDHLAFNYFGDRKLLAIPITVCEGGGDGVFGNVLTFSGLLVYDTTIENGFRRLGGVDHGRHGASCDGWWSIAESTVKRSIFMDDLVFSIATDRMKVQRLGHLGEDVADIALAP
jgi:hypothetical protein